MTQKKIITNQKGFTLIEMIMVLVIVGIGATVLSMGTIKLTEQFIFSRSNIALVQKGNLALTRIINEFTNITAVTDSSYTENAGIPTSSSISFTAQHTTGVGGTIDFVLSWATGGDLLLGGSILTDQVNQFRLTYYDAAGGLEGDTWTGNTKIIQVSLILTTASGVDKTFQTFVVPRNI